MDFAIAMVIVGATLVWAYYAPRVLATARQAREQRLIVAARPNPLERVAPGDPDTDKEFGRIVRRFSVTDAAWTNAVRRASRAARNAGPWAQASRQARRNGQLT